MNCNRTNTLYVFASTENKYYSNCMGRNLGSMSDITCSLQHTELHNKVSLGTVAQVFIECKADLSNS
jgi:hypothetical protein